MCRTSLVSSPAPYGILYQVTGKVKLFTYIINILFQYTLNYSHITIRLTSYNLHQNPLICPRLVFTYMSY